VKLLAEHDTQAGPQATAREFRVIGTGRALPEGARWAGTCPRTAAGEVWHLYEVTP